MNAWPIPHDGFPPWILPKLDSSPLRSCVTPFACMALCMHACMALAQLRYALCKYAWPFGVHTLVHESHTHGRSIGHVSWAVTQQQWHGKQHKILNKKSCFCLKPRAASRSMI